MSSSRKVLIAVTGGVVVMLLLAFVALTGMSASFAWTEGGGYGSGPGICQTATPAAISATPGIPGATPTPDGTVPTCVPVSVIGEQVVARARAMADALYVNPACGGHISYPDCYYTWYKAPDSLYPPGARSQPTHPVACTTCSSRCHVQPSHPHCWKEKMGRMRVTPTSRQRLPLPQSQRPPEGRLICVVSWWETWRSVLRTPHNKARRNRR